MQVIHSGRHLASLVHSIILVLAVVTSATRGQTAKPAAAPAASHDWPQFLGPDRNGISSESGLLKTWPADGPKEGWRVAGGQGMAGLAVAGSRLVTLVQNADQQSVLCLDAKTGTEIWKTDVAPTFRNQMGDGPRATPSIAGNVVFAYTGEGILAALKLDNGSLIWKKDALGEFDGKPADYGMASSPLVIGDKVVVTVGAPQATIAAFDSKSGKLAWTAGAGHPAGYSSAAIRKVGGREQLIVFHGAGALGLDPTNGTELWTFPYITDFNCNIVTPLTVGDKVFLSAGENHGSVLLSLKPRGDSFDVSPDWESHGAKSVLRNEWQTSILLDGYLYGFDNVGSAGPVTHLACINATTGKQEWQQLRFGKGNLIAADGKLFMTTMQGELIVANANPKKFDELGRKTVLGKTRTPPALANGLLYLRDDREVVCLDVRAP